MPSLATPIAGNDLCEQLRMLEREVDALTEVPLNAIPHTTRSILRSVSSLLITARWTLEDRDRAED